MTPDERTKAAIAKYRRTLGKRLAALRKERNLSQQGLADAAQLDQAFISLVEAGKKEPALGTLWRIAKGLQISVSELTDL